MSTPSSVAPPCPSCRVGVGEFEKYVFDPSRGTLGTALLGPLGAAFGLSNRRLFRCQRCGHEWVLAHG